MPLYFWMNDAAVGDATGHNFRQVWAVVPPAAVYIKGNADLGPFLVGANGMTVYHFMNDEMGVSNCVDQCATNWPPLTVESADALVAGANLPGELNTIERADGTLQVTYNGMPLYYWMNDAARGDATGENVGEVWFTIAPEIVTVGQSDELGEFLVAANGFTLYIFANDDMGVSNCYDQCAENWPPLLVAANERLVAGAGIAGELGTTERTDGTLQVTYNGSPLYFWVNDTMPGDTTGQGVNDVWLVIAP
jgi:predicted lipoprotein with Yx(FWY)xxD motif